MTRAVQPSSFTPTAQLTYPLDIAHLEYGLLRRALGDLAARVVDEVDRPDVSTWGFDRLARIDNTLRLFR